MKLDVFDTEGNCIGVASNFGEAKALHKDWLNKNKPELLEKYAGLNCSEGWLAVGSAYPAFYI